MSENRSRLEPSNISYNDNQPDKVDIKNVIFADGLGEITDIDVGPDGNLYVLSNYHETPTIFRISSVGGP